MNLYREISFIGNKTPIDSFDYFKGQLVNIILNGPSAKLYSSIPEEEDILSIYTNFGYLHDSFINSSKPFLIIVDQKILTGEWNLNEMLEEAFKRNSKVNFILNHRFSSIIPILFKSRISFIANDLVPTRWTKNLKKSKGLNYGGAVAEQSISAALIGGAKEIRLYGLEGTNVCLSILNKETHFYGKDNSKSKEIEFVFNEFQHLSYFLLRHKRLSHIAKNKGISIKNYSENTIINCYD